MTSLNCLPNDVDSEHVNLGLKRSKEVIGSPPPLWKNPPRSLNGTLSFPHFLASLVLLIDAVFRMPTSDDDDGFVLLVSCVFCLSGFYNLNFFYSMTASSCYLVPRIFISCWGGGGYCWVRSVYRPPSCPVSSPPCLPQSVRVVAFSEH